VDSASVLFGRPGTRACLWAPPGHAKGAAIPIGVMPIED